MVELSSFRFQSDTKHGGTFWVTDDEDLLGVRDNVKEFGSTGKHHLCTIG